MHMATQLHVFIRHATEAWCRVTRESDSRRLRHPWSPRRRRTLHRRGLEKLALPSPFFPMGSTHSAALPFPLATAFHLMKKTNFDATALSHAPSISGCPPRNAPVPIQMMSTNFAVVWATSFFFLRAGALSLVNPRTSSLPASLSKSAFFGRKKRTAVPQNPNQNNKRKHHTSSVTSEDGETSTSVTSGTIRTRAHESGSQSDKSSGLTNWPSQERSPQLSKSLPLLKMSKVSTETKPSHLRLTPSVWFSSFSSSLFLF